MQDLNQLRVFYTLAQTKNYSQCAKKLFVTQSAVSHAIKKLEQGKDIKLIQKKGNSFSLTEAGILLFQSCQKIFTELEIITRKLDDVEGLPDVIKLGSTVEFGVSFLIKHIRPFLDDFPRIHIDFNFDNDLIDYLINDDVDLIIDCKKHVYPELEIIDLFREEYIVIASPSYVFSNQIYKISDLERCNILSLDKELTWWNNFIHALAPDRKVTFPKVTRINHVRGVINAACCALGVGFVPKYTVLKELQKKNLVGLFPDVNLLEDVFRIYVKRSKSGINKISYLIEYLQKLQLT